MTSINQTLQQERDREIAHWHRLGMQVRAALTPSSPAAIRCYLNAGERLIASHGCLPWAIHESHMTLLLMTIADTKLPTHWRECCLDHCHRPLSLLRALALCDCMEQRYRHWAWHVAHIVMEP